MNSEVSQNFFPISKCYALNKITYFFPYFLFVNSARPNYGKTIYFLLFSEQKTRQITLCLSKLLCDLWNLFPFVVRNLEHKSYWNYNLLYTLRVIHKWRHSKRVGWGGKPFNDRSVVTLQPVISWMVIEVVWPLTDVCHIYDSPAFVS